MIADHFVDDRAVACNDLGKRYHRRKYKNIELISYSMLIQSDMISRAKSSLLYFGHVLFGVGLLAAIA